LCKKTERNKNIKKENKIRETQQSSSFKELSYHITIGGVVDILPYMMLQFRNARNQEKTKRKVNPNQKHKGTVVVARE